MKYFTCFDCTTHDGGHVVSPMIDGKEGCPRCGGTRGNVHSSEQFHEMREAGALFGYDAKGNRQYLKPKK